MEKIYLQHTHDDIHDDTHDATLNTLEKELQRLNNSYEVIPHPPPKRYINKKCGVCKDVSVKIGILIACLLPGIIVCVIGGSVLNDQTVTIIGASVMGSLGCFLSLFFVWLYGRKEKAIDEQWDHYWQLKAKIVKNNWELDDRKRRLIQHISKLKEYTIVSSNPIVPIAPPLELLQPDPSAPPVHPVHSVHPVHPVDFDESSNNNNDENDHPECHSECHSECYSECHHCYCNFKQNEVYTYNCCKAFKGHKQCLIEWGKYSDLCPICRTNLGNINEAIIVFQC